MSFCVNIFLLGWLNLDYQFMIIDMFTTLQPRTFNTAWLILYFTIFLFIYSTLLIPTQKFRNLDYLGNKSSKDNLFMIGIICTHDFQTVVQVTLVVLKLNLGISYPFIHFLYMLDLQSFGKLVPKTVFRQSVPGLVSHIS